MNSSSWQGTRARSVQPWASSIELPGDLYYEYLTKIKVNKLINTVNSRYLDFGYLE